MAFDRCLMKDYLLTYLHDGDLCQQAARARDSSRVASLPATTNHNNDWWI